MEANKPKILEDVSVVLIVLNNVQNIGNCIEAILNQGVHNIIIIDGGSTDGTLDVIKRYPCQLHVIGKTGLSHARQFGVDQVSTRFVALVDSDNILAENCLITLRADLDASEFVGVAAQKRAFNNKNIYCRFQEWMNSKKVNKPGKKLVIGTPALYYSDVLKKEVRYDQNVKFGDDTDLCYRLSLIGHSVGTGTGICYEKMVDNFKEFKAKAYLYGRADSEFFKKNKSRRHDIGTHALRNYLFKMSYHSIIEGKFYFLHLAIIYGTSRFLGLYLNLLNKK
jgi:glycosyltransferase involved in cell wall biosynthesis